MKNPQTTWASAFTKSLPTLAMIGPASWLLAALANTTGFGRLPGDLSWTSVPESVIMVLGSPFFIATFIYLGRTIAAYAPKTGIVVTITGLIGTAFLLFVAGYRLIVVGLSASGIASSMLNSGLEAEASVAILTPIMFYNLFQFLAWIIVGITVIRNKMLAPWWAGLAMVLSVPSILTAQAFMFHTHIFWPLGMGLWLLGTTSIVMTQRKAATTAVTPSAEASLA